VLRSYRPGMPSHESYARQIAMLLAAAGVVAVLSYVVIVLLGVGYHPSGPTP